MLAKPKGAEDNESITFPFTIAFCADWPVASINKNIVKNINRKSLVSNIFLLIIFVINNEVLNQHGLKKK